MQAVPWDLVVIDEAHRLRSVYKPENKTARILRASLATPHKVLLTATPLQNFLLELYGLISFIDERVFGDEPLNMVTKAKGTEVFPAHAGMNRLWSGL